MASELGLDEQALKFFGFATRLDLDDYNCNTDEGLHITSIAAAWMNIVYGFGGLRSDGKLLSLSPTLPACWKRLCFKLNYCGSMIDVEVTERQLTIHSTDKVKLVVYGKEVEVCDKITVER